MVHIVTSLIQTPQTLGKETIRTKWKRISWGQCSNIFQTIIPPFFFFLSFVLSSSWTRAQELCARWHETANLVSIHDHLENDFVTKQLAAHGAYTSAWIGYHRQPGSKYQTS